MTDTEFERAKQIIAKHPNAARFAGPVPEQQIADAERRLGLKFPKSYVEFLRAFGCGSFGAQEFLGVGVPATGVPSVIWYTETTRHDEKAFPKDYLPIYDAGLGEVLCLATGNLGSDRECPLVRWIPGAAIQPGDTVAKSFGEFFLETVRAQADNK